MLLFTALWFTFAEPQLLMDQCGVGKCAEREVATAALESWILAYPRHVGILRVGLEHKDPEIRWRVEKALRRTYYCGSCKGWGIESWLTQKRIWLTEEPDPCKKCDGTGISAAALTLIWSKRYDHLRPLQGSQSESFRREYRGCED